MTVWRRRKNQRERALAEAERARRESVDRLHGTVLRGVEVRRIANQLRQIQQENHFAESIRRAYGGGSTT
jgi:hypothetical protein